MMLFSARRCAGTENSNKERNLRFQNCTECISALNDSVRKLRTVFDDLNCEDIALPRFPDKATIIKAFNEMLTKEKECRTLSSELRIPIRSPE